MDEKPFETINVIPFVDIMLVLLTMVLTTANFIATGRIPLALPQASQTKVEKPRTSPLKSPPRARSQSRARLWQRTNWKTGSRRCLPIRRSWSAPIALPQRPWLNRLGY